MKRIWKTITHNFETLNLNSKVFLSLFSLNHFPNFETDRESPGMLMLFQSTTRRQCINYNFHWWRNSYLLLCKPLVLTEHWLRNIPRRKFWAGSELCPLLRKRSFGKINTRTVVMIKMSFEINDIIYTKRNRFFEVKLPLGQPESKQMTRAFLNDSIKLKD
jgi:hypothetical protein